MPVAQPVTQFSLPPRFLLLHMTVTDSPSAVYSSLTAHHRGLGPLDIQVLSSPPTSRFVPNRSGEEAMTIIRSNHAAIRSALVSSIALAGLTMATASWAEDAHKGTVAEKEVQAKLQYCKVCHGCNAFSKIAIELLPSPSEVRQRPFGSRFAYPSRQSHALPVLARTSSSLLPRPEESTSA